MSIRVRVGAWSRGALVGAALAIVAASDARASTDEPIAVGEIAAPPPSLGVDRGALRTAAEGEIRRLDASRLPPRRIVVSLAITSASEAPVACTIDAMLRDGKTGVMIAIIQGRARAEGEGSASLKQEVARAAVRSAVRQIPAALGK